MTRQLAWRRDGSKFEGDTITEMAQNGGVDFEYKLVPHFCEMGEEPNVYHIQEPTRIVHANGKSLHSVVNADFQFFQPLEIAGIMDEILNASKGWNVSWKPEAALSFGYATTVFIIDLGPAQVGKTMCHDFLTVVDTVDGKHALQAAITRTRIWCANMLKAAIRKASVSLSVRHSRGHRDIFRSNVENIMTSQGRVHEAMEKLAAIDITDQDFQAYLDRIFVTPEKEEDMTPGIVKKMGHLKLNAQGNWYRMVEQEHEPANAFIAFNAVQETVEHSGLLGSEKVVRKSLLTGKGKSVEWITKAFQMAELVF